VAAAVLAPTPAAAARLANGVLTANDATGATPASVPAKLSTAGLTTGPDGAPRFLFGYNMGNVRFIPFSKAPLSQSPTQLKALLTHAFEDMAATGTRVGERGESGGHAGSRRRALELCAFATRLVFAGGWKTSGRAPIYG